MTQRVLSIRDPVHGYVSVTAIEQALLDHPATQRLRWVAQSGLAQMVFPEVRTSRFTHSLGAMHLASQFLCGLLSNASEPARDLLADGLKQLVRDADGDVTLGADEVRVMQAQGLLAATSVDREVAPFALVAEQGLRLAALFHDLGHLPFSHDFEYVIRDLVKTEAVGDARFAHLGTGKPPHELIGYAMARLLQQDVYRGLQQDQALLPIISPAFKVARTILDAKPNPLADLSPAENVAALLHSLVDGEIDIDRSDYLLRDARAYGFDYVSFDLERLASNLAVILNEDGALEVVIRAQGQSAAESFLFSRYRMYQWGVFHHKVVQVGAALQHRTRLRLQAAFRDAGHPLHPFMVDVALLSAADQDEGARREALGRFATHDDIWWTTELRNQQPVDAWSDLVVRRKRGPVSLWKRASDFPLGQDELAALNAKLPRPGDLEGEQAFKDLQKRWLDGEGLLLSRVMLSPYARDDEGKSALRVLAPNGTPTALSDLSVIMNSLHDAWVRDIQVYAFAPATVEDGLAEQVATSILNSLT